MRYRYSSPEDFIRIWQTSSTVMEAADRLGLTKDGARERARKYRKLGILLKTFDVGPGRPSSFTPEGIKELNLLAKSLVKHNK